MFRRFDVPGSAKTILKAITLVASVCAFVLVAPPALAGGSDVVKVRLGGDAAQTRIVIELEKSVAAKIVTRDSETDRQVIALPDIDLIINGTSLGMSADDPPLLPDGCLTRNHLVYDMVYKPLTTPLIATARAAGARASNGLPMLLWQGAQSFEWWFDRSAPVEAMRAGLEDAINLKQAG